MAKYVPYSSRCKCSLGTMENYLSTDKGHGALFGGNPIMNANDHVVGTHITHFGECATLTAMANGFPKKCKAFIPTSWINVNKSYLVEGAPALTMDSLLPCFYGGIISITSLPPAPEDSVEDNEISDTEDAFSEEVPQTTTDPFKSALDFVSDAISDITDSKDFADIIINASDNGIFKYEVFQLITGERTIDTFFENFDLKNVSTAIKSQFTSSVKPFAKEVVDDIVDSLNLLEGTNVEKFIKGAGIAGSVITLADGVYDNYKEGANASEYVVDATVDVATEVAGHALSVGAAIGTAIGPGVGTVIGAGVGFCLGFAGSLLLDAGNDWISDQINYLIGND